MAKTYRARPSDGVAWVTGASSGIGRASALELARRGYLVAATARREGELEGLARAASGLPGRIVAHPGDVADERRMREVVETVERVHGPVVLAFLNAGIGADDGGLALDPAAFRRVFEVNLFGVVNGLSALLPLMAERRRGQVAVTASLAGYGGLPRAAAYGASKAALIHLCEALRHACDPRGITVQLVSPGFVDTPLTRRNDFPMPFLMNLEDAARRICDGFERGGFEITLPRRLALPLTILNLLPYRAYFGLMRAGTRWARGSGRG